MIDSRSFLSFILVALLGLPSATLAQSSAGIDLEALGATVESDSDPDTLGGFVFGSDDPKIEENPESQELLSTPIAASESSNVSILNILTDPSRSGVGETVLGWALVILSLVGVGSLFSRIIGSRTGGIEDGALEQLGKELEEARSNQNDMKRSLLMDAEFTQKTLKGVAEYYPNIRDVTGFNEGGSTEDDDHRKQDLIHNYEAVSRKLSHCIIDGEELQKKNIKLVKDIEDLEHKFGTLRLQMSGLQDDLMQARNSSGERAIQIASISVMNSGFSAKIQDLKEKENGEKEAQALTEHVLEIFGKEFPDRFADLKSIAHVSAEQKRISQYDAILRLYNEKLQALRAQENLDEEDREEAIIAMKRLRDREIEHLEHS